jgi:DNA-binding IclR family transcriptional regulator
MHQAASGRAILAFLEPKYIDEVLAHLPKGTAAGDTISAAELRQDLATIRERMFACTERGSPARISSIAAPVWGPGQFPIASIVLTSDSLTLPRSDFDRIGAIATNVAEQGTRALGGSYPVSREDAP